MKSNPLVSSVAFGLVLLIGSVLLIRLDSHPSLSLLLAGSGVDQLPISRPPHLDHQLAVDVELVGRQNLPEL